MRFNTVRYLFREGFHSLYKNFFMSAASVLVLVSCLLITGCSYLVFQNVEHGFEWAYQQNVVVAYAKSGATDEQVKAIGTSLSSLDNVAEIEFMSKEDLLNRYKEEFGELLEDLQADNPLQDAFVIHFKDLALFDTTVSAIQAIESVDTVDYNTELSASLVKVRDLVLTVGTAVIALLLLVSLFIIANTIKLTVYSRRLEIFIMRSVGATGWFIRFPFMVEGIMLGGFAGGISYGLVYLLYFLIRRFFTFGVDFQLIPFTDVWWQLLVGFLAGGILTGLLGSAISIGKYLKENKE